MLDRVEKKPGTVTGGGESKEASLDSDALDQAQPSSLLSSPAHLGGMELDSGSAPHPGQLLAAGKIQPPLLC